MAITNPSTVTATGRSGNALFVLMGRLSARFAAYRRYRRTLAELRQLSPRELDDIGLAPGDIEAAARGAFLRRSVR